MQRKVGTNRNHQCVVLNYSHFDITTRILPAVTISDSPAGMMGNFKGMVLDDRFVSPTFVVNDTGTYDLYMYCITDSDCGNVLFYLNQTEIIGSLEFYSKNKNVTIKKIEGIQIKTMRKVFIQGHVDYKEPKSTGYNITIGDIWLHKRE